MWRSRCFADLVDSKVVRHLSYKVGEDLNEDQCQRNNDQHDSARITRFIDYCSNDNAQIIRLSGTDNSFLIRLVLQQSGVIQSNLRRVFGLVEPH